MSARIAERLQSELPRRPIVPLLAVLLIVRILTDDDSAAGSRASGSLNLSGVIAVLLIALGGAFLLAHRRGTLAAVLCGTWLLIWTALAVHTAGASGETVREAVREASVLALGFLVYNSRGAISALTATRLVQVVGVAPAVVALVQWCTGSGLLVAEHIRANGTFAHPNSAAMFFSLAATASLWSCLFRTRGRVDAALFCLFAAALIATFSIDGLTAFCAMLLALGVLGGGSRARRLIPVGLAALVAAIFFATPLGGERIAGESATNLRAAERGEPNSTFAWRLYKWRTLVKQWEQAPVVGKGVGTTTTGKDAGTGEFAGSLPHNEYLRYLVETGVVGTLALLAGLAMLIRALARRWRLVEQRTASTLALAVVVGCMVNSLGDNTLLNSPTCYAAALLATAALSVSLRGPRAVASSAAAGASRGR